MWKNACRPELDAYPCYTSMFLRSFALQSASQLTCCILLQDSPLARPNSSPRDASCKGLCQGHFPQIRVVFDGRCNGADQCSDHRNGSVACPIHKRIVLTVCAQASMCTSG